MNHSESETFNQLSARIKPDPEYNLYVQAWLIYHRCCEEFDNHFFPPNGFPRTFEDRRIMYCNVKYANSLMGKFTREHGICALSRDETKWTSAKLEALRIVERGKNETVRRLF